MEDNLLADSDGDTLEKSKILENLPQEQFQNWQAKMVQTYKLF